MTIAARTLCIGCTAAFLTSGGSALAQVACEPYVVVAGDNLRFIARTAYGDADLFRVIYNANIDVIGPKADLIEIGEVLDIPCDPNAAASTQLAAASGGVIDPATQPVAVVPELPVGTVGVIETAAPAPEAAPETAAAAPAPLRIVTGNGYAPFADEMLPGGGMFTQLVEMAIFRADPAITYNLSYVSALGQRPGALRRLRLLGPVLRGGRRLLRPLRQRSGARNQL